MKKLIRIIFLSAAVCAFAKPANADDRQIFGLKGEVLSAEVKNERGQTQTIYQFSDNGKLLVCKIEDEIDNSYLFDNPRISGTSLLGNNGNTGVISGGRVTAINFKNDGHNCSSRYHYDNRGLLTKITYSENWTTSSTQHISGSAAMNAATKRARSLEAQLAKTKKGTPEYNRLKAQHSQAVKEANINSTKGQNITRTQGHSESGDTKTFSDYKFDKYGNWISRQVKVNNGRPYTETQTIVYTPKFICETEWNALEKEGDLVKIAEFYNNTDNITSYREKAKEYWNKNFLAKSGYAKYISDNAERENISINDCDWLMKNAAGTPICNADLREKIVEIVRPAYLKNVLNERDFQKVFDSKRKKVGGITIFNEEDVAKINKYGENLKTDSISKLKRMASDAFNRGDNNSARKYADLGLSISFDKQFADLFADSSYNLFVAKLNNKSQTNADVHSYYKDMKRVAAWNTMHLADATLLEEKALKEEEKERKKRERKLRFERNVEESGKICRVGGAFETSFGEGMCEISGGVGAKLGWYFIPVNLYAGVQIGAFKPYAKTSDDGGSFSGMQVTFPIMLRFNLFSYGDYYTKNNSVYLGAGVNISLPFNGKLRYTEEKYSGSVYNYPRSTYKSKDLFSKSVYYTPRLSFGLSTNTRSRQDLYNPIFDVELYALYELQSIPNPVHIANVMVNNPTFMFDRKAIIQQVHQRLRVGLAVRLLF